MVKTVVVMGTLDTKGEEIGYVKNSIERRGLKTIVIDTSLLGLPSFPPDISQEEVAQAAGTNMTHIIAVGDEAEANKVMAEGASRIVHELYASGKLDGIIALGGSMGTSLGLSVMKTLPLGIPKLMVSTIAFTPLITPEVAATDLTMMQSPADMWGLNRITETTLASAAAAISGMVEAYEKKGPGERPLVGITTLGTAAFKYVWHIKPLLEEKGYEVAVFHSVGVGGRTFEQLIEQGVIVGALDLCTTELIGYLSGGMLDAGPNRLEAAGRMGIPQVVAPGGLGAISWAGSQESLPPRFQNRGWHSHNILVGAVMATKEEMASVGALMAAKLNRATGPTAVLIPMKGFAELDRPGQAYYHPEGIRAFTEALERHIDPKIKVMEMDAHINDPGFAEQAVDILEGMMKGHTINEAFLPL